MIAATWWETTAGKRLTRPPTRDRRGQALAPGEIWSAIRRASGTALALPPGCAGFGKCHIRTAGANHRIVGIISPPVTYGQRCSSGGGFQLAEKLRRLSVARLPASYLRSARHPTSARAAGRLQPSAFN